VSPALSTGTPPSIVRSNVYYEKQGSLLSTAARNVGHQHFEAIEDGDTQLSTTPGPEGTLSFTGLEEEVAGAFSPTDSDKEEIPLVTEDPPFTEPSSLALSDLLQGIEDFIAVEASPQDLDPAVAQSAEDRVYAYISDGVVEEDGSETAHSSTESSASLERHTVQSVADLLLRVLGPYCACGTFY
jgi:hypothetical protein